MALKIIFRFFVLNVDFLECRTFIIFRAFMNVSRKDQKFYTNAEFHVSEIFSATSGIKTQMRLKTAPLNGRKMFCDKNVSIAWK